VAAKHPGFQKVAAKVAAKEGIPMKNARKIIAASGRDASKKAKLKNPVLKRING
jgi:hypothetical protein